MILIHWSVKNIFCSCAELSLSWVHSFSFSNSSMSLSCHHPSHQKHKHMHRSKHTHTHTHIWLSDPNSTKSKWSRSSSSAAQNKPIIASWMSAGSAWLHFRFMPVFDSARRFQTGLVELSCCVCVMWLWLHVSSKMCMSLRPWLALLLNSILDLSEFFPHSAVTVAGNVFVLSVDDKSRLESLTDTSLSRNKLSCHEQLVLALLSNNKQVIVMWELLFYINVLRLFFNRMLPVTQLLCFQGSNLFF